MPWSPTLPRQECRKRRLPWQRESGRRPLPGVPRTLCSALNPRLPLGGLCYHQRMRKTLIFGLIAGVAMSFSFGAESWTGMWRIHRYFEGKIDSTYHVFITPAGEVTGYTDDARPLIIQAVTLDEDQLSLQVANSAKQPLPVAFNLTRIQQRASGDWTFAQMQQEPLKGVAVGFRVFSQPKWSPWDQVEKARGDRLINLLEILRAEAPRNTFAKFLEYFRLQIEPNYYFLVQSWLYGDNDPERGRRKALAPLFEKLVQGGDKWSAPSRFSALAAKTLEAVHLMHGEDVPIYLVSYPGPEAVSTSLLWTRVPTEEDEQTCACKLDLRERFVLVNPTLFDDSRQGDAQMAMHLSYPALWGLPPPNLAVEVFRRSLTVDLALEATGNTVTPLDAGLIDIMKDTFRPVLLSRAVPGFPRSQAEQSLAESLGFTLGGDFLAWFKKRNPDLVPVKTDEIKVMNNWIEYLTGIDPTAEKKTAKRSR